MRRLFALSLILIAPLNVLSAHAQNSTRVRYGEIVRGQISNTISEQSWTVGGQEGDLILVDVQADNSYDLDTYVALTDSSGSTLMSDDDSGEGLNSRLGPFRLPQTGDYTISVSSYSGSGGYTLQVVNLNTVPTLVPGKPLAGTLDAEHTRDFFLLAPAETPHTLWRLVLSEDSVLGEESIISLFDTEGFVTSTEYLPSVLDPVVPLPGETYLAVASWNPASTGGPYQLLLEDFRSRCSKDGASESGSLNVDQSYRTVFLPRRSRRTGADHRERHDRGICAARPGPHHGSHHHVVHQRGLHRPGSLGNAAHRGCRCLSDRGGRILRRRAGRRVHDIV